jgi:hypothetical protein
MYTVHKGSSFDEIPRHWDGGGSFGAKKINVPARLDVGGLEHPQYSGWKQTHVEYTPFDGPSAGSCRYLGDGNTVVSPDFEDALDCMRESPTLPRQSYPRACKKQKTALAFKKKSKGKASHDAYINSIDMVRLHNGGCVLM